MNKKLLTIAIVLVILVAGIPFASAAPQPAAPQNPNPSTASVWTAINDLIAKVAALTTKVNSIPAGQACWDLDKNGQCNPAEDINHDLTCDVKDCQGPKGDTGATGPTGAIGATGPTGPSGMSNIVIKMGSFNSLDSPTPPGPTTIDVPIGFTATECKVLILGPQVDLPLKSEGSVANGFHIIYNAPLLPDGKFHPGILYGTNFQESSISGEYVMICQKI